jgi:hypothetical protein
MKLKAKTLTENEITFRDLNKNGKLDPYEDLGLLIEERVEDLLQQMSLEEKAGLLFHTMLAMNEDGSLTEQPSPFSPMTFGRYEPKGRLPFELPSSMEAVRKQKEDLPYDSQDPLVSFGFGLRY